MEAFNSLPISWSQISAVVNLRREKMFSQWGVKKAFRRYIVERWCNDERVIKALVQKNRFSPAEIWINLVKGFR